MRQLRSALLLCSLLVTSGAAPAISQEICRPTLSPIVSGHSDVVNFQRKWTGVFAADASRCAVTTGPFEIEFVRLNEVGPDLAFTESFTWSAGQTEATLDLSWDEWVNAYRIKQVQPCPCRG
jgi:hypothetical protein